MRTVNIHEAKSTLSQLIEAVERGEEVVIARAGRPCARLVGLREPRERTLGTLRGVVPELGPEFFEPLPDVELDAWER